MKRCPLSLLVATLALGCGGGVAVDGAATAGAGGSAGASSGTTSAATTTGTGGTDSPCADTYVDVEGAGPVEHLLGSCPNDWGSDESAGPVAFFVLAGGAPKAELNIFGCAVANAAAPSLRVFTFGADASSVGEYSGVVEYTDANGVDWYPTAKAATIGFTQMAAEVGDVVEGRYEGSVSWGGDIKTLFGTFRACRVQDHDFP